MLPVNIFLLKNSLFIFFSRMLIIPLWLETHRNKLKHKQNMRMINSRSKKGTKRNETI